MQADGLGLHFCALADPLNFQLPGSISSFELLFVYFGEVLLLLIRIDGRYLGPFPIFLLGAALCMPVGMIMVRCMGCKHLSKRYAMTVGPGCVFFPIFGFGILLTCYSQLRQLCGPWLGLTMPLALSCYEFLGTVLVSKNFRRTFLTQTDVRRAYGESNQGIIMSMSICNLHALAEGARLTLLYVDHRKSKDPNRTVTATVCICIRRSDGVRIHTRRM